MRSGFCCEGCCLMFSTVVVFLTLVVWMFCRHCVCCCACCCWSWFCFAFACMRFTVRFSMDFVTGIMLQPIERNWQRTRAPRQMPLCFHMLYICMCTCADIDMAILPASYIWCYWSVPRVLPYTHIYICMCIHISHVHWWPYTTTDLLFIILLRWWGTWGRWGLSIRWKVCLIKCQSYSGGGGWHRCQLNKENRCQRRSNMYVAQVGVGVRFWADLVALGRQGAWWHGGGGLDVGSTGVEAVGVWRRVWGGCWAGVGRIWVGHGAGIGWAWDAGGFMPRGEGLGWMRMCGCDGLHGAIFCIKQ